MLIVVLELFMGFRKEIYVGHVVNFSLDVGQMNGLCCIDSSFSRWSLLIGVSPKSDDG